MFASHRWKILQELIERVALFEVVKQGLDRHPSLRKNTTPLMTSFERVTSGFGILMRNRISQVLTGRS